MRRLAGNLAMFTACFCVGTVIVAGGLAAYLWSVGALSAENAQTIVAILRQEPHGVTPVILTDTKEPDCNQASFAQRRAERDARALDLDLREQAIERRRELVRSEVDALVKGSEAWRREKAAFELQLADLQSTAQGSGRDNVRLILENLKPRQAKDQIVHMLAAKEFQDVAAILLSMPIDKRAKIIGEFKTPEEIASLDEVLKAIRAGDPQASLIDKKIGGTLDKTRQ